MFGKLVFVCFLNYILAAQGVPKFEKGYEVYSASEGERLDVLCLADGDPPLDYIWYDKNTYEILSDPHQRIFTTYTTNASFLVFKTTIRNDSGEYTCSAKNTHGLSSKVFEIIILPNSGDVYEIRGLVPSGHYSFEFNASGKIIKLSKVILLPDKPEVIFRTIHDGTVRIEWNRKFGDFHRGTIDFHSLSYTYVQRDGRDGWKKGECPATIEIPTCTTPRFTISDLSKNIYYEIRLRAHTSSGYGKSYRQKVFFV
ncbi:palladin-like isoform X2 [Stegodyphus dumicola]|uniref:palladin-like isoform X2 n=1 Tax=Stegodyphus dumicola TaxID=202533 RepID=UPI0015ACA0D0|nr:palladin-like isoform X2 [Stegodyphus dumicola]